jgi:acetyl esterase/lipase
MLYRLTPPLLLLAVLFLALASPTRAQTSTTQPKTLYLDSQYGSRKAGTNIAYSTLYPSLLLDVYMPTEADLIPRFPAFIILHGSNGSKELDKIVDLCQNWSKRGYVTVPINYNLWHGKTAAEAVRWVRANADKYKVDPSRIAIGGGSAGASTAMMAAFREISSIGPNAHVSVVLDLWGQTKHLGIISEVDNDDPPVYIVHGDADELVLPENSLVLESRLNSVGVVNRFQPIPGAGHSCFDAYWNHKVRNITNDRDITVDQDCAEFFYTHLNLVSLQATADSAGRTSWTSTHFNTTSASGNAAWTADPDADGSPNLLEYAFGTLPTTASSRPSVLHSISVDSPRRSVLTFNRTRSDVTYEVLASSDLSTWKVIAVNPGTVGQSVTVTDSVELTTGVSRFLRVRATLVEL